MFSRGTRFLMNASGVVMLVWIGYVLYGAFTGSGVWRIVLRATSSDYSYSPAGTFSLCALMGILPLIAISWVIWRIFLRG